VGNSELRFLTVENTGGNSFARALYVGAGSPRIRNVTVLSSGGTVETQGFFADGLSTAVVTDLTASVTASAGSTYGVLNVDASSTMTNVQSNANGGAFAHAFWNCCASVPSSAPTLRNVVGIGSGGTGESRGMTNADMSPVLENVVAIGAGPSPTNRGLVNVGSSAPYMRFVTCRGNGATVGNFGCYNDVGTHPTMMDVYAEASGGSSAEAMHNEATAAGLSLSRARLVASGGSSINRGYYANAASPPLTEVEAVAIANGGSESTGVYLNSSFSTLSHVTASGSSSATVGNAVGIHILGSGAAPTLDHVVALGIGASQATGVWSGASTLPTLNQVTSSGSNGAAFSVGLFNQSGSTLAAVGTISTAAAPAGNTAYAIWNQGSSLVTLSDVRAVATGGSTNYGILNNASAGTVKIDRSMISGATGAIQNAVTSTVSVGGSQLVGGVNATGTYTCVFSYNGAFAALNATCN
jgi:hypothetical protein